MFNKIKEFFIKKEWSLILFLVLLFIIVRLPGLDIPLHQDEYKWPIIVNPTFVSEIGIPHPPLSEFIYRTAGKIVGFNTHFRFVPLFFGTINLILLYFLVKIIFGRREAIVAGVIWILSYFSVLASLMVDTDGEIMPFFFLLALIGYYKLKVAQGRSRYIWGSLLIISCVLGFLVKISFLLAVGAIIADFLWSKKNSISKGDIMKYAGFLIGGILGLIALLFVVRYVFPFFNLGESIKYWEHFAVLNRGWLQTAIQCFKTVLFASPLLALIPFFSEKKDFSKIKFTLFTLIFAFVFYIVLFDFSLGALDRYLQIIILPLTIITTVVITPVIFSPEKKKNQFIFVGVVVAVIIILLQLIPHSVPPLHPKAEWIQRILSLKWNFVYPFSGGSGPLPFYVSFLFIGLIWIISFLTLFFVKIKSQYKKLAILFLLPIALSYNLIFTSEYLLGIWNGSASKLIAHVTEYIKNNPEITKVTVYNDNGGNEIMATGKYRKRLYVDPKFDIDEKIATLNKYKEHYLIINIPRIDPTSVYQRYFDSCKIAYQEIDKKISATIYDCRNASNLSR